jgi:hypothetical protein
LAFLIEKESSYLISKILVVEDKFKEVINLINLRSNIHVEQLQSKLAEIGFIEGQPLEISIDKVESLLGIQLVSALKRLTNSLISITEDAIQSHEEIMQGIKSAGIKIFPNKRILSFEYIQKDKQ